MLFCRPDNRCELEIPECRSIIDEITSGDPGFKSSAAAGEHLLTSQPGFFGMLLLKTIGEGVVKLGFINGLKMEIRFDHKSFPTLGIWWNNGGYPPEGRVRTECAFEPIPGTCSDLSKSFRDGVYLSVNRRKKVLGSKRGQLKTCCDSVSNMITHTDLHGVTRSETRSII